MYQIAINHARASSRAAQEALNFLRGFRPGDAGYDAVNIARTENLTAAAHLWAAEAEYAEFPHDARKAAKKAAFCATAAMRIAAVAEQDSENESIALGNLDMSRVW